MFSSKSETLETSEFCPQSLPGFLTHSASQCGEEIKFTPAISADSYRYGNMETKQYLSVSCESLRDDICCINYVLLLIQGSVYFLVCPLYIIILLFTFNYHRACLSPAVSSPLLPLHTPHSPATVSHLFFFSASWLMFLPWPRRLILL